MRNKGYFQFFQLVYCDMLEFNMPPPNEVFFGGGGQHKLLGNDEEHRKCYMKCKNLLFSVSLDCSVERKLKRVCIYFHFFFNLACQIGSYFYFLRK